jgi:hypothetical protein
MNVCNEDKYCFLWAVVSALYPANKNANRKSSYPHFKDVLIYSVETTYGINSIISKLTTFVENVETGQFLFLIMLILSSFTCS